MPTTQENPPLLGASYLSCGWAYINISVQVFLTVGQAVILGLLTRYFSLPCDVRNSAEETRNAYLYATGEVTMIQTV